MEKVIVAWEDQDLAIGVAPELCLSRALLERWQGAVRGGTLLGADSAGPCFACMFVLTPPSGGDNGVATRSYVQGAASLGGAPRTAAYVVLHDVPIKRFMIRIEAPTWEDFEVVELPRLPAVGETIQTKYGTCLVTQTDASSGTAPYQGKIVVRLP